MHRFALILGLTACAANGGDEGFNIVNNIAPSATCTVSPGGGFLSHGTIDKHSPNPYVFTPEIQSRIEQGEGTTVAQRTVILRGAKVDVQNAETGTSLKKFTSLFAASLEPLGSTTVSFDIVPVDVLSASTASGTTRQQLVAKITPFGALGGSGDNVDGVTFEYPVTVCDGCVAQNLGACPLPSATIVPNDGVANGCNKFQDGLIYCCMGATGLVCPPPVNGRVGLTVTKTGTNKDTAIVTSTPVGIDCGATCTGMFDTGTMVTLTATGSTNVTWTGVASCNTGATCTVTMDIAHTVNAALN